MTLLSKVIWHFIYLYGLMGDMLFGQDLSLVNLTWQWRLRYFSMLWCKSSHKNFFFYLDNIIYVFYLVCYRIYLWIVSVPGTLFQCDIFVAVECLFVYFPYEVLTLLSLFIIFSYDVSHCKYLWIPSHIFFWMGICSWWYKLQLCQKGRYKSDVLKNNTD